MTRSSRSSRARGRRRGRRVWVKAHCRRKPTAGWVKRERAKKAMPF